MDIPSYGVSHKRCKIKHTQVPIEPGFALTVYKAQGKTMGRVILDLVGCVGTEPPYVMVSRATSLDGLMIMRDFDSRQIMKRPSEELRREFARLSELKWVTIAKYGSEAEAVEAKKRTTKRQNKTATKPKKRKVSDGKDSTGRAKRPRISNSG